MLWYNNPESIKADMDARCRDMVSEDERLMRVARIEATH